jgi:hypothetical protein
MIFINFRNLCYPRIAVLCEQELLCNPKQIFNCKVNENMLQLEEAMTNPTQAKHPCIEIGVSTLQHRPNGAVELGVVYAIVEGIKDDSFDACLAELMQKAQNLGATSIVGMQLMQTQYYTSLVATAVKLEANDPC